MGVVPSSLNRHPAILIVTGACVLATCFCIGSSVTIHCLESKPVKPLSGLSNPKEILQAGEDLALRGNWRGAQRYFQQSEVVFQAQHDEKNRLYAHINVLRANLESLNVPVQALANDEAELASNPIVSKDNRLLMRALAIKGDCAFNFDPASSYDAWQKVLKIASEHHDYIWESRASGELGFVEFFRGNTFRAMALIGGAIATAKLHRDVGAQIRFFGALSNGLYVTYRYPYAMYAAQAAIDLATSTPGTDPPFLALITRAKCLIALGHEAEGVSELRTLLADFRKKNLQIRQVFALLALSEWFASNGQFAIETVEYAQEAHTLASQLGLLHEATASAALLSKWYLAKGNLTMAERYALAAVDGARHLQDSYDLPRYLSILAALESTNGRFEAADATYREAFGIMDNLLSRTPAIDARNTIINATTPVYKDYLNLIITKLHEAPKALQLTEYIRARSINDFLISGKPKADDGLEERMEALSVPLYNRTHPWVTANAISDEGKRPLAFSGIGIGKTSQVSQQDIQRMLRPTETVLIYLLATPRSFVIAVTQDTVEVVELASGDAIKARSDALLARVLLRQSTEQLARQLYGDLVAPILPAHSQEELIIIPDGALNKLPFELLLDTTGRYLVETHTVSYAESAASLYLLRHDTHKDPTSSSILVMGGLDYNGPQLAPARGVISLASVLSIGPPPKFGQLFSSMDEALSVHRLIGGPNDALLIAEKGTKEQLKALPLDRFSVMHFATHAFIDPWFPEHSALVLGDSSSSHEGYLQVQEITRLRLRARLVTLATCNSGVGNADGLGAYGSIAQAFMTAGAHSVLATDWQIDDGVTAQFMESFYGYLAAGNTVSHALQTTKNDMIRQGGLRALPYYWAGFRLIGDGRERIRH